ncbi:hypothetical protein HMPREF1401_01005 [Helicobacter pylori GAM120Ai]|uniref:Tat pathway signal sequence domain protein n=1 Tax=Helicobacter pylori GAM120Ai TaxID=1159029 RepID=A0AAV3IEW8_HELPX|nr:hypothetical protein [Helicobacter pylori]EMG95100.1 hypothetical protein HMPREF1401_01005 [Helicobacter pylori GAM120Ai]
MKNKLLGLLILNAGLFASVPNPADADVIVWVVKSSRMRYFWVVFMDYKLFHMDSMDQ